MAIWSYGVLKRESSSLNLNLPTLPLDRIPDDGAVLSENVGSQTLQFSVFGCQSASR